MKTPTLLLTLLALTLCARADLTEEQRRVPLEVDSPDPKLAKIVLIAGPVSNKPGEHEYFAGCALMMDWLKQTTGVWPVLVAEGWPKNEAILDGAKAVVVYADTAEKLPFLEPARWAHMKRLIDAGTGFVMLHQSADVPADHADEIKSWLGAVWQKDTGCRGHWDMDFDDIPMHPITRGVAAFHVPFDGWLFNLQFAPGATPLLSGMVPDKARTTADAKTHMGRPEVVAWAYERPNGGRSFAFTGCHIHRNWSLESERRLVTNGILWAAKLEVPSAGAPVALNPASLANNLDSKPTPPAKAAAPAPAPAQ
ncbi:MAG: ThuA domain-containing protein [Chthoniobacter sp.]|nr:ThuA domain-containing protein [Chthoniobacter sp.]